MIKYLVQYGYKYLLLRQKRIRQFGGATALKVIGVKRILKMTNDHKYIGNNKKPENCFEP